MVAKAMGTMTKGVTKVAEIKKLLIEEHAGLNADRLAELYVQLGEVGAQDVVCRAMEELAVRLTQINAAYEAGKFSTVGKGAKGLIGIAEQIGMQRLADVAQDVRVCAGGYDPVALGAVLARLLRVGDYSLTAVWDLQDISG